MSQIPTYLTTAEAAVQLGVSRATMWRVCKQHRGFAVRLWGAFKVPEAHIERIKAGQSPELIAAEARTRGASRAA